MLDTIMENAGTIMISLLLIGLVAGIIVKLRRDKKKGTCSCGGNCGCCPMGGCCHKQS